MVCDSNFITSNRIWLCVNRYVINLSILEGYDYESNHPITRTSKNVEVISSNFGVKSSKTKSYNIQKKSQIIQMQKYPHRNIHIGTFQYKYALGYNNEL